MSNEIKMRKTYSRYALALAIYGVIAMAFQLFNSLFLFRVLNINTDNGWISFVNVLVPMYLIAFPVLILLVRKDEVRKPEKNALTFGKFLVFVLLMFGMMGVGVVFGTVINYVAMRPFGLNPMNNTEIVGLMMNSSPVIRIVTAGILGPIVEEFIFRKFLIDRTYRYGEWVAILSSALLFGLYHGNLAQFFSTTMLGGLFAYIYIRTGKIWYTIALHMVLNLTTSVITISLLKPYMSVDQQALTEYTTLSQEYLIHPSPELEQRIMQSASAVLPKMVPYMLWMGILGTLVMAGVILWIVFLARKKFTVKPTEEQVKGGFRYAWFNIGMLFYILFIAALVVINTISLIQAA